MTPRPCIGFPEVQLGLLPGAGGVVRTVRMLGLVDALMQLLLQGQRQRPAKAKELGIVDEVVGSRRRARAGGQGVDQGPADRRADGPAVGRQGLQDPRRHPVEPEARAEPAGVPGQPAQAAQGRQLPRAAPHHGRGGRGRAGRLRQRDRDRGPLLRGPGHRPGVQEHDPGVLLRHAARVGLAGPARGHRDVQAEEDGRARRRDDGRRDRLRVGQGRHRGRAQGRLPGGGRPRQAVLGEAAWRRPSRAGAQTQEDGRRAAGPDHRHRRAGAGGRAPSW